LSDHKTDIAITPPLSPQRAAQPQSAVGLRSVPIWTLTLVGYLAIVVALWLPFGLRTTGTYEEWTFMHDYNMNPLSMFFWFSNRPLFLLPSFIGYGLTPGSYVGLNVVEAALIFGKGFAAFLLLKRLLPKNSALAFVFGALVMVYPVGVGFFSLRTTASHMGVLCCLLAAYLLIRLWERFRWITLIGVLLVQWIGLATYEAGLPLTLLTPILLLGVEKHLSRRLILYTVLWLSAPLYATYAFLKTLSGGTSYQSSLFSASGLSPDIGMAIKQLVSSVWQMYLRHFLTGWLDAFSLLKGGIGNETSLTIAMVLTLLVLLPILAYMARREMPMLHREGRTNAIMLMIGAVIAVFFGYMMYIPTDWRDSFFRTYFYSTLGAALFVTLSIFLASQAAGRWRQAVFVILALPLLSVSILRSLNEHAFYYEESQNQLQLLAQIIDQAPRIQPKSLMLVIDIPPSQSQSWSECTVISNCLNDALKSIYPDQDQDFQVLFCVDQNQPLYHDQATCKFDANTVTIAAPIVTTQQTNTYTYPYSAVAIWENSAEQGARLLSNIDKYRPVGGTEVYNPARLIDHNAPIPSRVYTMFSSWPFKPILQASPLQALNIDFKTPVRGMGWSAAESAFVKGHTETLVWTTSTTATLNYWLSPTVSYRIRFSTYPGLLPDILPSLQVTVNKMPIALTSAAQPNGEVVFDGIIPRAVVALSLDNTVIAFHVTHMTSPKSVGLNDDTRLLGLHFHWIQVDSVPDLVISSDFCHKCVVRSMRFLVSPAK